MNNFESLIEYIIKDTAEYLIEDFSIDLYTALRFIYNSDVYARLSDPETGLYTQSSAYVYQLLKAEYRLGKLPQTDEDII